MLNLEPTKFTIYTERHNDLQLQELVNRYFDGATINYGHGLWKGETEISATITILARHADLQTVVNLAGDIKHVTGQQSVIVTAEPVTRIDV